MTRFCKILGIALSAIAIVCLGISISQDGQQLFLQVGLLCNCLALLIYLFFVKTKK